MLELTPGKGKELVEVEQQTPLALTGVICPSWLYAAETETCAWEPEGAAEGGETATGTGTGDEGAPAECPLCAYIKGGGCREEFLPFQACIQKAAETDDEPDCMRLFGVVADCMIATEANKTYYAGFIADFPHLFGGWVWGGVRRTHLPSLPLSAHHRRGRGEGSGSD